MAAWMKVLYASLQSEFKVLQASIREAEDKAYDERFEKPVRWDFPLEKANIPPEFELYAQHSMTLQALIGAPLELAIDLQPVGSVNPSVDPLVPTVEQTTTFVQPTISSTNPPNSPVVP
ncbi:unnamed protein product [Ilex paraguariensis]|uniref:Uncharacterized protein n=1 Tax=Ilex paraguariensis TaxID=185542 RepID=A0ABC8SYK3_9AQUA